MSAPSSLTTIWDRLHHCREAFRRHCPCFTEEKATEQRGQAEGLRAIAERQLARTDTGLATEARAQAAAAMTCREVASHLPMWERPTLESARIPSTFELANSPIQKQTSS